MKKTLIALAALASTAAFAQSSVTLSGRLDMGMLSSKSTTTTGNTSTPTKVTDVTGNQNGRTTSRITLAGVEDLGGGLKAAFNVETGINPSDASGLFAGNTRNGTISLITANMGTFTIGTISSNAIDAVRGFSAASANSAGGDFLSNTASGFFNKYDGAGGAAARMGLESRSRNAIAYVTPNFSGFTGSLGLHSQKNVIPDTKTSGSIVGLSYVAGPLTARAAFGSAKNANSVTGTVAGKLSTTAFGASYNLGMAVPYFAYEADKKSSVGPAFVKANALEFGARFPMGALTPYVAIATGSHKDNDGKFNKTSGFQVGTTYDLSKRTYAYLSVGSDKVKASATGVNENVKRSAYSLGLVHSF